MRCVKNEGWMMSEQWDPGSDAALLEWPIRVSDGQLGNVIVTFRCKRQYQLPENAWLEVDVSAVLRPEQADALAEKIQRSANEATAVNLAEEA